jgi:predicted N-acetyltransferase YhbS
MSVRAAEKKDIPAMVELINDAYRGEASHDGWTTEADMVEGDLRTDEVHLSSLMDNPDVIFLLSVNEHQQIDASVFLEKRNDLLYLGMLCVNPKIQAKGLGKVLMQGAEHLARNLGCHAIIMRVISIRDTLIAWYERQGYIKTGELQPFEDGKFGKAKIPIEFVVMQKEL